MERLPTASAHCDGPCGIYDPASARVAAEAVLSMAKKLSALKAPASDDPAFPAYLNTFNRYVAIKEEQAELTKRELLILWTDFFKPQHLDAVPNLHEMFWKAAKQCSECKQHVEVDVAQALLDQVKTIHETFWKAKGRDVEWVAAGG